MSTVASRLAVGLLRTRRGCHPQLLDAAKPWPVVPSAPAGVTARWWRKAGSSGVQALLDAVRRVGFEPTTNGLRGHCSDSAELPSQITLCCLPALPLTAVEPVLQSSFVPLLVEGIPRVEEGEDRSTDGPEAGQAQRGRRACLPDLALDAHHLTILSGLL